MKYDLATQTIVFETPAGTGSGTGDVSTTETVTVPNQVCMFSGTTGKLVRASDATFARGELECNQIRAEEIVAFAGIAETSSLAFDFSTITNRILSNTYINLLFTDKLYLPSGQGIYWGNSSTQTKLFIDGGGNLAFSNTDGDETALSHHTIHHTAISVVGDHIVEPFYNGGNNSTGHLKMGSTNNHNMMLLTNDTNRLEISNAGSIKFNDAYEFPTTAGTTGQILKVNGSNLVFENADYIGSVDGINTFDIDNIGSVLSLSNNDTTLTKTLTTTASMCLLKQELTHSSYAQFSFTLTDLQGTGAIRSPSWGIIKDNGVLNTNAARGISIFNTTNSYIYGLLGDTVNTTWDFVYLNPNDTNTAVSDTIVNANYGDLKVGDVLKCEIQPFTQEQGRIIFYVNDTEVYSNLFDAIPDIYVGQKYKFFIQGSYFNNSDSFVIDLNTDVSLTSQFIDSSLNISKNISSIRNFSTENTSKLFNVTQQDISTLMSSKSTVGVLVDEKSNLNIQTTNPITGVLADITRDIHNRISFGQRPYTDYNPRHLIAFTENNSQIHHNASVTNPAYTYGTLTNPEKVAQYKTNLRFDSLSPAGEFSFDIISLSSSFHLEVGFIGYDSSTNLERSQITSLGSTVNGEYFSWTSSNLKYVYDSGTVRNAQLGSSFSIGAGDKITFKLDGLGNVKIWKNGVYVGVAEDSIIPAGVSFCPFVSDNHVNETNFEVRVSSDFPKQFYRSIMTPNELRLQDSESANYVGLTAPSVIGSSYSLTMPSVQGGLNAQLNNDGLGNLSWVEPTFGKVTYDAGNDVGSAVLVIDSDNYFSIGVFDDVLFYGNIISSQNNTLTIMKAGFYEVSYDISFSGAQTATYLFKIVNQLDTTLGIIRRVYVLSDTMTNVSHKEILQLTVADTLELGMSMSAQFTATDISFYTCNFTVKLIN